MLIKECDECREEVLSKTDYCSNCGVEFKANDKIHWLLVAVLGGLLVLLIFLSVINKRNIIQIDDSPSAKKDLIYGIIGSYKKGSVDASLDENGRLIVKRFNSITTLESVLTHARSWCPDTQKRGIRYIHWTHYNSWRKESILVDCED